MAFLKRIAALVMALALIALIACKPPEEQKGEPGESTPGGASGGMVYAEESIELGDIPGIEELRTISDGTLMGIGVDYETGEYSLFKLDENGKLISRVAFSPISGSGNKHRMYTIDFDGGVYVYEVDMTKYWGGPLIPLEEPTEEGAEATQPPADEAEPVTTDEPASSESVVTVPEPRMPDFEGGASAPVDENPVLRKYGSDGKQLLEIKLPPLKTQGEGEYTYPDTPYRLGVDPSSGLLYTLTNTSLSVFDLSTGELKRELTTQNGMYEVAIMKGGYVLTSGYEEGGLFMRCFNPLTDEEKWSKTTTSYPESLSYNASDGKLYGKVGRKIMSFDEQGNESILLELSDFSVLSPFYWMRTMAIGKDGMVFCVLSEQSNREKYIADREKQLSEMESAFNRNPNVTQEELYQSISSGSSYRENMRLVRIALTDAANVPPKTEITVSVMYEDYTLMSMASAFHASNPGIRIKLKEMIPQDEINNPDIDYNQLIQRVNTEIISGRAADVLLMQGLPFESYARKNILEDLLPYMENDPDFNMADYRKNVLDSFKVNGKLFALPTGFSTPVFLSKSGEFTSPDITMSDFFEKLFKLKNEELPLQYSRDATGLYYTLLYSNIPQFKDADGNITLDSPEFIAFLENIKKADEIYKKLPAPDEGEIYDRPYAVSSAVAMPAPAPGENSFVMEFNDVYGYYAATGWKQQYGKDFETRFIPSMRLPNTKGFSSYSIYGINRSSKQKDAAWQFLKFLISEQMQASDYAGGGCPINMKAGERQISMMLREADLDRRQYELDRRMTAASGNAEIENDPYYQQMIDNLFTREDADNINRVLEQVDTYLSYDTTIINMANEELEPYLKGQKSAADTAKTLQSRLSMYLSEQG